MAGLALLVQVMFVYAAIDFFHQGAIEEVDLDPPH